jgi:hypothetical protein
VDSGITSKNVIDRITAYLDLCRIVSVIQFRDSSDYLIHLRIVQNCRPGWHAEDAPILRQDFVMFLYRAFRSPHSFPKNRISDGWSRHVAPDHRDPSTFFAKQWPRHESKITAQ